MVKSIGNWFIFASAVILVVGCSSSSIQIGDSYNEVAENNNHERPNIVLIQVDDMGYDDLSFHGNTLIETPALDQLAQESVRFEQFYVSSLCAPTRATLLTGRHSLRTGVSGVHGGRDFIHLDETLISNVMKDAGYTTGMWGKWHSGKTNGYFPWDRGFDEAYYATLYNYFDNNGLLNGKEINNKGFTTNTVTDLAIDFIGRNKQNPFFAYVSYLAPHNPWRAPEDKIEKYKQKGLSHAHASLYGMIDTLDENIGRLLASLEQFEIEQNTIVVFLSDNGPWVKSYRFGLNKQEWIQRNPNKKRGKKGKNWENGIHSPLFVRWPQQYEPTNTQQLASVEDLFPTILDWAGIKFQPKHQLDGMSLVPAIENSRIQARTLINSWATFNNPEMTFHKLDKTGFYYPLTPEYRAAFSFDDQRLFIRDQQYKYIKNEKEQGTSELFDLIQDPLETNNLVKAKPKLVKQFDLKLLNWHQQIMQSPHALKMPVFQIGYANRKESQIYASAPSDFDSGLMNKDHFIANWNKAGQWAEYDINVITPGEYDVYLISKMKNYNNHNFEISFGTKAVSATLTGAVDKEVGTLIRNESAYWEDFDQFDTFKQDISNQLIGAIRLNASDKLLRLKLSHIKNTSLTDMMDQVIAIQLVRQ